MTVVGHRVTVGSTATRLDPSTDSDAMAGKTVRVKNAESVSGVDLGGPGVTFGDGFRLAAGESIPVTLQGGEELYAVAQMSAVVHVLEVNV